MHAPCFFFLAAVVQLPHGGLHREVADGSRGEGGGQPGAPEAEALRSPATGFATAARIAAIGFAVARIIEAVKK